MRENYAIEVRNLTYGYGKHMEKMLLKNINFHIKKGGITTILGTNGSGKTTLLRLLLRLTETEKEKILLQNRFLEEYSRKELAQTVSVLPQSRDVASITVEKLVEHGRFPYLGLSRSLTGTDREMIEKSLERTGISHLRDRRLDSLSGGERQKVYIAMTFAQDTPIIFMDEPTTYLDIRHQYDFLNVINELNKKDGKTIVMVLHDISMAMQYSHEVLILHEGAVAYQGEPKTLTNSDVLEKVFHVQCHQIQIDQRMQYVVTPAIEL